MFKKVLLLAFLLINTLAHAQVEVRLSGRILDNNNVPLKNVSVQIRGQNNVVFSNEKGEYILYSKSTNFTVDFILLGYALYSIGYDEKKGARIVQNITLQPNINELEQVAITQKTQQLSNTIAINVQDIPSLPMASSNFESILKTLPGVSVNNELSAQYSVRGGNYNENALYLNDVEINRPIYVRNSQQEGLSFINPDLVSRARFSAGGFEARYGDKLASVLDVKYEAPDQNELTLSPGLLNSSITFKRKGKSNHFLIGARYKNNATLLRQQDVKGRYSPNFADLQAIYQFNASRDFQISFFGNLNGGVFNLVPDDRQTDFGTQISNAQLFVLYEGKERTTYFSSGAAVSAAYYPNSTWTLKWTNSYFSTVETENTHVLGKYRLGSSTNFDAFGTHLTFIDNFLKSNIYISDFKIEKRLAHHVLSLGAKWENKYYREELNEISEVGAFNLAPDNLYQNYINHNRNQLNLTGFSAFVQDSYQLSKYVDLQLGARLTYSDYIEKFVLSPRLLFAYRPKHENTILRFSLGVHNQDPDFRTLKNMDGYLIPEQDFQRSFNATLGYDYAFNLLNTRLKLSSEIYFKYGDKMIPYIMDNMKIRYFSNQLARSRTYGMDFMLGGELVKDLVSQFRISLMKAEQREISNPLVTNAEPYYVGIKMKRPTDQRINMSAFFQDKLVSNPSYRVHLNMVYGSQLPIGQPEVNYYSDRFKIPSYKRIDIGFSKDFLERTRKNTLSALMGKQFDAFVAYVEVFNLLNMNNTASYLWIKDINGAQYGVPNYHTGRQLNIRLIARLKNK